jgi:hypothetical protein
MTGLLYREDIDAVRDRLTIWWNGGDIGRPAIKITAPRETPLENIPALPQPSGWETDYSISNWDYRVNLTQRACINTFYLGDCMPTVAPDLAPGCLSLYLGCRGIEHPGSVWLEPRISDPATARFVFNPNNKYWQFTLKLGREQLRLGKGKFQIQYPDLIEGLDTLAGMRHNDRLLVDLIDRPEWVKSALKQITQLYFQYYDPLYDLFKDERGGSNFWCWAPGRVAKLQCDFSAMISAPMYREFMLPVLLEMTQKLDYTLYHWDGPGALQHHDALLSVPRLNMLQWTPGDGQEPVNNKRWWPLYHKTTEAGKGVYIGGLTPEDIPVFKKEFGQRFKLFMVEMRVDTPAIAERVLQQASD